MAYFSCTSCTDKLDISSPSVVNKCGHVFHELCVQYSKTCASCQEPIENVEKTYFSVCASSKWNVSKDLREAKKQIKKLEAENEGLRSSPDKEFKSTSKQSYKKWMVLLYLAVRDGLTDHFDMFLEGSLGSSRWDEIRGELREIHEIFNDIPAGDRSDEQSI